MDKTEELVEALLELSKSSERVAKLLSQHKIGVFQEEAILTSLGTSRENVKMRPGWPRIDRRPVTREVHYNDLVVLEWCASPQMPLTLDWHTARHIDLIVDHHDFTQLPNMEIVREPKYKNYDIGVVWESFEFIQDPSTILRMLKKYCHNVLVKFRPWSSQDGAFLADKAFTHLAMDVDHQVKHKVVRPLATYEKLIASLGMTVVERQINTVQVDPFFTNPEILRVIKERTWGSITDSQAIQIMATDSVEYVLS